jgi:hypothetical protein
MALRVEDYAMIGDTHTGPLVGNDGSIDWLCLPRFDSGAVFAALLGDESNGRWLLAPLDGVRRVRRRYRAGTLVLDTELETDTGAVRIADFMPHRDGHAGVVRIVEGIAGRVPMGMRLVMRFDYGRTVPWVRRLERRLMAVAGPDALVLDTPVAIEGEDHTTVAGFSVSVGEQVPFVLSWLPSTGKLPDPAEARRLLEATEAWWRAWSARCTYRGEWRDAVSRSCATLKGLTYGPTGGIVAALTTSVPKRLGGVRNWDYRYVWLRDATLTLHALLATGYVDEARAWRDWLVRAVAGDPAQLQIMYGGPAPDHVRGGERAPAARARARLALGLRGIPAGAGRQRGHRPAPTRRLRGGDGRAAPGLLVGLRTRHACMGDPAGVPLILGVRLAGEGIWEVRGPRRGGNRSAAGAEAAKVLGSIICTAHQQGPKATDVLIEIATSDGARSGLDVMGSGP